MSDPEARLRPQEGEVHLWWIDLERVANTTDLLSPMELARAERLRQPLDRARWTAARAALRQILARYVARPAAALRLEAVTLGKPILRDCPELRFSLSHAAGRAALAVAWQCDVGVDLEPLAAAPVEAFLPASIAASCSQSERAWLDALPAEECPRAFLTCWALKEAYLKGVGCGLHRDPRTVALTRIDDRRAVVADDPTWCLTLVPDDPEWIAALACAQPHYPRISHRSWPAVGPH